MEMKRQQPLSHLFTVRLWQEELGNGQAELRGKVQHVPSGEVRYFRDWPTLITFLCGLTQLHQYRVKRITGADDQGSKKGEREDEPESQ